MLNLDSMAYPTEAAAKFGRARELFAECARLRPDNPEYRFSMAAVDHNEADALELAGRFDQAEQGYRRSRQILGELLVRSPDNDLYARDLASSTGQLGRCLLAKGKRSEGTAELARALELWDRLLVRSPREPSYLESRAWTLTLLGRLDEAVQAAETLRACPTRMARILTRPPSFWRRTCRDRARIRSPLPGSRAMVPGRWPITPCDS